MGCINCILCPEKLKSSSEIQLSDKDIRKLDRQQQNQQQFGTHQSTNDQGDQKKENENVQDENQKVQVQNENDLQVQDIKESQDFTQNNNIINEIETKQNKQDSDQSDDFEIIK